MNSNHWDVKRMISVNQESVKLEFACKSLVFTGHRKDFLIFLIINCHLGGHIVCILILFFTWLHAKCLQLDSNFIANNKRKQMGLRHFFSISHNFLHLKLSSILDAILDISKCSMMPEWHHLDSSRTMYALPKSTKKKV